jgi:hypothetical protein
MALNNSSYGDNASPYRLNSAILTSEKLGDVKYDIRSCITDLNIYEDINKPFLTGKIIISDFNNVIHDMIFTGEETIKISFEKIGQNSQEIIKTFYLDHIIESKKINNNSVEIYAFHMVEDVEFESNLINVNKYYEGKPSEIIKNIILDYIPKRKFATINPDEESQETLKVVIPNLNPIEAIIYVTKKAYSTDGLPYFLFSSFAGPDVIYYINLSTLLKQTQTNFGNPFTFWQSGVQKNHKEGTANTEGTLVPNRYQILNYSERNNDDLRYLISEGFIGSSHRFVDVINGEEQKVDFSISKTLLRLSDLGVLTKNYPLYTYSPAAQVDKKFLSEIESKKIYNYPSTKPYELGFSNSTSMVEENNNGNYAQKVNSSAILNLLYKRKIQVTVKGINFIHDDINRAVGNLIEVEFLKLVEDKHEVDKRLSGKQLVTNVVHMFKPDDYTVNMDLCKLETTAPSNLRVSSSGGQDTQTLVDFFAGEGIGVI